MSASLQHTDTQKLGSEIERVVPSPLPTHICFCSPAICESTLGKEPCAPTPPPAEEQPDNWVLQLGKPKDHRGARAGPSPGCPPELPSGGSVNSYKSNHYPAPCTGHLARHFTHAISSRPHGNSVRWVPSSPLTDKETEA